MATTLTTAATTTFTLTTTKFARDLDGSVAYEDLETYHGGQYSDNSKRVRTTMK